MNSKESAPRLSSQGIVFARVRLMTEYPERSEWVGMPIDRSGVDIENACPVWLPEAAIITAAEARAAMKGGKA